MSNISLPCNKRESGGMMNVGRTEVQGGRAGRDAGPGMEVPGDPPSQGRD